MVGLGRVELPTYGLGNRRSIQLSYSPVHLFIHDGLMVANEVTEWGGFAAHYMRLMFYRPAAAARFRISSGDTSSLCVAMYQRCPKGSSIPPVRSP
jgi:hypothetical protein